MFIRDRTAYYLNLKHCGNFELNFYYDKFEISKEYQVFDLYRDSKDLEEQMERTETLIKHSKDFKKYTTECLTYVEEIRLIQILGIKYLEILMIIHHNIYYDGYKKMNIYEHKDKKIIFLDYQYPIIDNSLI